MARSDDEMMLICAVRYAQGRMTYVVSEACGWVRNKWPDIDPATRRMIWRDLQRFLEIGAVCPEVLGMQMDGDQWKALSKWIQEQGVPT